MLASAKYVSAPSAHVINSDSLWLVTSDTTDVSNARLYDCFFSLMLSASESVFRHFESLLKAERERKQCLLSIKGACPTVLCYSEDGDR